MWIPNEQIVEVLRVLNVALGVVAFLWCLFKMNKRWESYDLPIKAITMCHLFFSFAVVYGSSEQLYQAAVPGWRPVFTLIAIGSLLFALWELRGTTLANYGGSK